VVDFRPILLVIGSLLIPLGLGMLFPALVELGSGNSGWPVFITSSGFTLFMGVGLYLSNRGADETLTIKQGFLLTSLVWVVLPAFAALPFIFSELQMSYTDAYFEAMSGLTTTGSTVIVGLDSAPPRNFNVARAAAVARGHWNYCYGDCHYADAESRRDAIIPDGIFR